MREYEDDRSVEEEADHEDPRGSVIQFNDNSDDGDARAASKYVIPSSDRTGPR